jgi:glycosyltransferase involved in cell wall biosynthesis
MRIALCHEWLTVYGGSDQVAAAIADTFEITDVYTFAQDPGLAAELFPNSTVRTAHRVGDSDFARKHWGWLLPVMSHAWRSLDLSDYDVVLTSSHSCVNAIRVPPRTQVISYCHTPMRYAWDWRDEVRRFPAAIRPAWPVAAAVLRRADRRWSKGVTTFVANSQNVADRITRYYGRRSTVVHPPIDVDYWTPDPTVEREDFYLYAGRLVSYKRPDLAIAAANESGSRLDIAGTGPEAKRLRAMAGPTVRFIGNPSRDELRDLYRRTRALVFPGVEDFGMTLVEAQACGAPVLARAEGGALEIVRDGVTGVLFSGVPADLARTLSSFEPSHLSVDEIVSNAARFRKELFEERLRACVHSS